MDSHSDQKIQDSTPASTGRLAAIGAGKMGGTLVRALVETGTAYIESHLPKPGPVVRSMPNTPALMRVGMTALAPGRHALPEHLAHAEGGGLRVSLIKAVMESARRSSELL